MIRRQLLLEPIEQCSQVTNRNSSIQMQTTEPQYYTTCTPQNPRRRTGRGREEHDRFAATRRGGDGDDGRAAREFGGGGGVEGAACGKVGRGCGGGGGRVEEEGGEI